MTMKTTELDTLVSKGLLRSYDFSNREDTPGYPYQRLEPVFPAEGQCLAVPPRHGRALGCRLALGRARPGLHPARTALDLVPACIHVATAWPVGGPSSLHRLGNRGPITGPIESDSRAPKTAPSRPHFYPGGPPPQKQPLLAPSGAAPGP